MIMMKKKMIGISRVLSFLTALLLLLSGTAGAELRFTEDADAIEHAADSVFLLEIYNRNNQKIGVGSGFVAFSSSVLVTNYHVIDGGAYVIAVSDEYDRYMISRVCATDKAKDIAILCFDEENVAEPLELDGNSELKRSQPVVAIGSPAGLMNTVSIGNISAFYKRDGKDWIQFTAPISSGSSGGALLNDDGKVIGITTATYASTQNINMAVKAENVIALYEKWDGKKTVSLNGGQYVNTTIPTVSVGTTTEETAAVYVSSGGKKYHNNPQCSHMRNPIKMNLLDAIEKGYEPCGKCYK